MQESIKLSNFIEVTTQVVERTPQLGKLPTLLIVKQDDALIVPVLTRCNSLADVTTLYSYSGAVASFAKNYFSVQNRAGDYPDSLYIFTWNATKATNPSIVGGKTPSLDELKKVNGKFKLRIDSTEKEITLNLSGKNNHTEVATTIETAIKQNNNNVAGFKDATVKWSSIYSSFIVTAGAGAKSISTITPGTGTDISAKLGLSESEGARTVPASDKLDTLDKVLALLETYKQAYFVITFGFDLTKADLLTIGTWTHQTKNDYLGLCLTTDATIKNQRNYTEAIRAMNGVMVEYTSNLHATNGLSAGLMSSVDYSKLSGNINIAYNEFRQHSQYAVSTLVDYDNITKFNRANCLANVDNITKGYTWYQPGNIMGDTEHANVYISHFVIKKMIETDFATFLTKSKFPSTADKDKIAVLVFDTLNQARARNLIVTLPPNQENPTESALDSGERLQLDQAFGNAKAVESQLISNGFYVKVGKYDADKKCVEVSIAYVANVPIKKVCIKILPLRGN